MGMETGNRQFMGIFKTCFSSTNSIHDDHIVVGLVKTIERDKHYFNSQCQDVSSSYIYIYRDNVTMFHIVMLDY